ncbi:Rv1733c family protein [Geodermatophilus sp. SYSU D00710]
MTARLDALVRRSLRRLVLGSGPLRRPSDRVQAVGRLAVVASLLVAPLLAVAASTATSAHLTAVAAAEAADRSHTRAVLLEQAPSRVERDDAYGAAPALAVPVRAAWPDAGGALREGVVLVPPGTATGTAVPVWIDGQGEPTSPPLDPSGIPTSAAVMGALSLVGLPLATWTLHVVLTSVLDARRERAWEAEWAAVEPEWRSRLL